MVICDTCDWAVCYDIDGSAYDDKQPRRVVAGWFCYPFQAGEFIEKILPAETKDRFYILHRNNLNTPA